MAVRAQTVVTDVEVDQVARSKRQEKTNAVTQKQNQNAI